MIKMTRNAICRFTPTSIVKSAWKFRTHPLKFVIRHGGVVADNDNFVIRLLHGVVMTNYQKSINQCVHNTSTELLIIYM